MTKNTLYTKVFVAANSGKLKANKPKLENTAAQGRCKTWATEKRHDVQITNAKNSQPEIAVKMVNKLTY